MNYLQRSFQISFARPCRRISAAHFDGGQIYHLRERYLVIDFTLEDSAGAENAGDGAVSKGSAARAQCTARGDHIKRMLEAAEPPRGNLFLRLRRR